MNIYLRDQAIELGYGSSGLFIFTFKYPLPSPLFTFKNCSPPLLRPEKMLRPPKKNKNKKNNIYIIMKNIAIKNDCSVIF